MNREGWLEIYLLKGSPVSENILPFQFRKPDYNLYIFRKKTLLGTFKPKTLVDL
jgi:hypothetical protein